MKKLIIVILLLNWTNLFSQGFNWQYSSRLPFTIPKLFYGGTISSGIIVNSGKFTFLEDHIPCCDYEAGDGKIILVGLTAEYWLTGFTALNATAGYNMNSSEFQKNIEVPRSDGKIDYLAIYNYYLDESRDYFGLDIGMKQRLFASHLSFGGNISLNYLISSSAVHKEKILSPEFEKFIDGTKERIITNGILREYNNFIITPSIFINYDFSLGIGFYSSVKLFSTLPIVSVVKEDNWKEWKIGINVSLFKSY